MLRQPGLDEGAGIRPGIVATVRAGRDIEQPRQTLVADEVQSDDVFGRIGHGIEVVRYVVDEDHRRRDPGGQARDRAALAAGIGDDGIGRCL